MSDDTKLLKNTLQITPTALSALFGGQFWDFEFNSPVAVDADELFWPTISDLMPDTQTLNIHPQNKDGQLIDEYPISYDWVQDILKDTKASGDVLYKEGDDHYWGYSFDGKGNSIMLEPSQVLAILIEDRRRTDEYFTQFPDQDTPTIRAEFGRLNVVRPK